MMTVKQVSQLTGVSVRTLQYYDRIGLLPPGERTEAGYRLYDDTALERLQQILLFRELEFPLSHIKEILDSPDFDRKKALEQQITLLELKREHIDDLITFARGIKMIGVKAVDLTAFNKTKLEEYARRAKEEWGGTKEYQEMLRKSKDRTPDDDQQLAQEFMEIFAKLGQLRSGDPGDPQAQELVKDVQDYITENMYTCTDQILAGLGKMYAAGGEISDNIDKVGGTGTAEFTARAIEIYCSGR